ncbi:MAG: hypothetical protein JWR50_932 [Mucilaginibacter sp.]|nr:hypothetical protein [Mucilaginibacter sp.]
MNMLIDISIPVRIKSFRVLLNQIKSLKSE